MKDFGDVRLKNMIEHRPAIKKRAVVTSGLPYGNKSLHCGHITLFIHSDFFARFLRDRIGFENVIYQSGTDCYGSPAMEGYRKAVEKEGFKGTIVDYVTKYHNIQKDILDSYHISTNIYGASAFGEEKPFHDEFSAEIFKKLIESGSMEYKSTLQFFDKKMNCFLNGRQVVGKCPIDGCLSEHAYADECDLGHQYMPKELINPVSVLSGETPEFKEVGNWYFNVENYIDELKEWLDYLDKNTSTRKYMIKEVREFLKKPEIYIKQEYLEKFKEIEFLLPTFEYADETKNSFTVIFNKLSDREFACEMLTDAGIRYRTGKTLTPFRITGNLEWGVKCPDTDKSKDLTFYVWPESLWAQISLTKAYLNRTGKANTWKDWWCSKDCNVYQFIGEDNIYFYGPVQMALWLATQGKNPTMDIKDGDLMVDNIVANKHTLFLNNKASSSADIKPPMADELLNYYTEEQLRMHYLTMNVSNNSANFMPKAFNPNADPNEIDPVIREYNLLTNVFNRVLRNLCYTWQRDFDGFMPYGTPDTEFLIEGNLTMLKVEKFMMEQKFHMVCYELDTYIRNMNKYFAKNSSMFEKDKDLEKQVIVNTLHMVRVAITLLHPVAPTSIEKLVKFMGIDEKIFSWKEEEKLIYDFIENPKNHKPTFLNPKEDFFVKHPSQYEETNE